MIVKDHLVVQLEVFIYSFILQIFFSFKLGLLEEYISHNTEAILRPTLSYFLLKSLVLVILLVLFTKWFFDD